MGRASLVRLRHHQSFSELICSCPHPRPPLKNTSFCGIKPKLHIFALHTPQVLQRGQQKLQKEKGN